ncbi:hypothetical protein [Deinococcus aestuarii]|uniref:hypothetical protein n=1 Tax=Deinococcus aestuarii TaxID=2774531 RepID=UPI001C0E0723|nr:hypothetical protein [Deinococcus aestuarii]
MTGRRYPAGRVLLCLSLAEQRVTGIEERLLGQGEMPGRATLRAALDDLVSRGLAHVEKRGAVHYFRLAEGHAVEEALDEAWETFGGAT